MASPDSRPAIQIDVVSDVVCPWCIIGFLQLDRALQQLNILARLRWHPFELNPSMGAQGQNLREHVAEKYGSTAEQSQQARDRITALGAELGFTFNFDDQSKIVNTFEAHQLLDSAEARGRQHPLKLELFHAYFSEQRDVSDRAVLLDVVEKTGLDASDAQSALETAAHAASVRQKQQFWSNHGVAGVPTMVFAGKYLLTGAQGTDTYFRVLQRCLTEVA